MEEAVREAACLGNLDGVKKLLHNGACINAQHSINGWTALHWACKRGHVSIAQHLLESGAIANLRTSNGESVADVSSDPLVLRLLQEKLEGFTPNQEKKAESLSITPSYLLHPLFPYYDVDKSLRSSQPLSAALDAMQHLPAEEMEALSLLSDNEVNVRLAGGGGGAGRSSRTSPSSSSHPPLVVKVRQCGSGESDFVEVEVVALTYQALLHACCEELELSTTDVAKIRKLPNILVRKDRDIQRMREGQELEVVIKSETVTNFNTSDL